MLKQLYDATSFLSVIKKDDIRKWDLWQKKDQANDSAKELVEKLKTQKYQINSLQTSSHKGKVVYISSEPQDYFALRLVDRYLRRIYKVVQSDRGKIIRQIRVILEDGGRFTLIRSDIKSFYESINFAHLLAKVRQDMIISPEGLSLLESLKKEYDTSANSTKGVPRGIGISATLSELYLRNLDKTFASCSDVIFYSRYVDDIFIIVDQEKVESVKSLLKVKVEEIELEFNSSKELTMNMYAECSFSYLGYLFEVNIRDILKNGTKTGTERVIVVKIAPEKIVKIKQRIYKSFLDFKKTNDFQLMLNRLRYLACSKIIKKTENGAIYAGNAYNYCYVTNPACFKVFDAYIFNRINDFSFSPEEIAKIKRISFYRAFLNKDVATYTRRQISSIKKVWNYE